MKKIVIIFMFLLSLNIMAREIYICNYTYDNETYDITYNISDSTFVIDLYDNYLLELDKKELIFLSNNLNNGDSCKIDVHFFHLQAKWDVMQDTTMYCITQNNIIKFSNKTNQYFFNKSFIEKILKEIKKEYNGKF